MAIAIIAHSQSAQRPCVSASELKSIIVSEGEHSVSKDSISVKPPMETKYQAEKETEETHPEDTERKGLVKVVKKRQIKNKSVKKEMKK